VDPPKPLFMIGKRKRRGLKINFKKRI